MKPTDSATKWFVFPQPSPQAQLRLFCLPYAGGGISIFRTWSQYLPPTIEVCAIQLPGRENRLREPAFTQITPLIQALDAALPSLLDKPYALFGHSMGAIIAFELARLLLPRNTPLRHLFVSGRIAPQVTDAE